MKALLVPSRSASFAAEALVLVVLASGCSLDHDRDGAGNATVTDTNRTIDAGAGDGGPSAGPDARPVADSISTTPDASTADASPADAAFLLADPRATFFVTSDESATGNLGGLAGADRRCQKLAAAAGLGHKTWVAYLSASQGGVNNGPVHARERIGENIWINTEGRELAPSTEYLHRRSGSAALFLDDRRQRTPNGKHDILTGSDVDGYLRWDIAMPFASFTCSDWTSAEGMATVGHSDGSGVTSIGFSWSSAHDGAASLGSNCENTSLGGGAGKIYCFALARP